MAHDVFISYSVKDKAVADAVCATLEARRIRCWIAPRDVRPGGTWADEIVQAINSSRAFVLVFSSHSDNSDMVNRELDLATDHRLAIIPFRIEDITPSGQTKFYLAGKHWLDALTPPLEQHLESLVAALHPLLDLLGPQEAPAREEHGVEKPSGRREAAPADAARPLRGEQPLATAEARGTKGRFKLKRWHYVVGLAIIGLVIVWLAVPYFMESTQSAKLAYARSCIMNAEIALQTQDFTHAIFEYEQAMKARVDPKYAPNLQAQIKSGLAEAHYRRGMKLQGEGEFQKAVEDLEKAASIGGVREDPAFMANLKKAAAQQARAHNKDKNAGSQPQ
jgi:tetratricopeptide (TPR) repeat protein